MAGHISQLLAEYSALIAKVNQVVTTFEQHRSKIDAAEDVLQQATMNLDELKSKVAGLKSAITEAIAAAAQKGSELQAAVQALDDNL